MTLRRRIEELERRAAVEVCKRGVHLHEEWKNPRIDCPICRAMTEREYLDYQAGKPDGRITIVIRERSDCSKPADV